MLQRSILYRERGFQAQFLIPNRMAMNLDEYGPRFEDPKPGVTGDSPVHSFGSALKSRDEQRKVFMKER
jgi:hypothetical protein